MSSHSNTPPRQLPQWNQKTAGVPESILTQTLQAFTTDVKNAHPHSPVGHICAVCAPVHDALRHANEFARFLLLARAAYGLGWIALHDGFLRALWDWTMYAGVMVALYLLYVEIKFRTAGLVVESGDNKEGSGEKGNKDGRGKNRKKEEDKDMEDENMEDKNMEDKNKEDDDQQNNGEKDSHEKNNSEDVNGEESHDEQSHGPQSNTIEGNSEKAGWVHIGTEAQHRDNTGSKDADEQSERAFLEQLNKIEWSDRPEYEDPEPRKRRTWADMFKEAPESRKWI